MRLMYIVLIAVVIIALGVGLYYLLIIQSVSGITVSVESIRPVAFTADHVVLDLGLRIRNKGPLSLSIGGIKYSLYADGTRLGDGYVVGGFTVPSGGSVSVNSKFNLTYIGALRVIVDYLRSNNPISWRVVGDIYVNSPLGTMKESFNATLS